MDLRLPDSAVPDEGVEEKAVSGFKRWFVAECGHAPKVEDDGVLHERDRSIDRQLRYESDKGLAHRAGNAGYAAAKESMR